VHGSPATLLSFENINFGSQGQSGSASAKSMGMIVAVVGGVLAAACLGLGLSKGGATAMHAMAAFTVGVMSMLAISLGCLFYLMVWSLLNAGWGSTIKRQVENVASLLPVFWFGLVIILVIEISQKGLLLQWMDGTFATDYLLLKKAVYFWGKPSTDGLPLFFIARTLLYGAAWWYLCKVMVGYSRQMDTNPSPALAAKMRFTSAWGLPVFALTLSFAAFDYLMGVDFKFFSTMWGVYYFATAAFSGAGFVAIVLTVLMGKGKLRGVVTEEHFHDLGKLMFAFTVFWAYISFCQYFLYWYSNIPEETAFYLHRKTLGWQYLGAFLMIGHFGVPFLFILSRHIKKSRGLLMLTGVWFMIVHIADIFWVVRPMVYPSGDGPGLGGAYIDVLGIGGVLLVFVGLVIRKVASGPLVGVNEPYMGEALEHRNYV
jgi:hypothetical protein